MQQTTTAVLAAIALLAGCASNPVIPINAPGLSVPAGTSPHPAAATDLASARQFALQVRAVYRSEMANQVDAGQRLNSGLLILGAGIVGLATGGAHRDAILGGSLIGGTAYTLGTINLDKRRLLVLSAGVKALDCATASVLPMDLGADRQEALVKASQDLREAIKAANRDGALVRNELLLEGNSVEPEVVAARAALAQLEAALIEAGKSLRAADKLKDDIAAAGKRLQQTVLEITQKVDAAMIDTLVDLSAIPQLVGGLGGFASQFAPGAGIDKMIGKGFGDYKAAADKKAADAADAAAKGLSIARTAAPGLKKAMDQLTLSSAELARTAEAANDLVAGVNGAAVAEALKACNVAGVTTPIALVPGALNFTAGVAAAKGFAIEGGTKPYSVRWLDAAPDALTISFDGGFGDTAQVKQGAANLGPGSYQALVSDASSPRRNQQLTVTVDGAAAAPAVAPPPIMVPITPPIKTLAPAPGAKAGAPPPVITTPGTATGQLPAPTLEMLAQSFKLMGPLQAAPNLKLAVADARVGSGGKTVEVTVSCTPAAPATRLMLSQARAALFSGGPKLVDLRNRLKASNLLDDGLTQIVFVPAVLNCIAEQ